MLDIRLRSLSLLLVIPSLAACAQGGAENGGLDNFTFGTSATMSTTVGNDDESDGDTMGEESTDTAEESSEDSSDDDTTDAGTETTTEGSSDGAEDCGNGIIDDGEDCDGTNLGGANCVSLGFDSGTLACDGSCLFDVSACESIEEFCGDGIINGAEECDGADLGGATCEAQGFDGGSMACDANCILDSSGCTTNPSDTIIDFEDGMIPQGVQSGGAQNWGLSQTLPYEGVYGAESGDISDSQDSWVQVTANFPAGGSVSFYRYVSSESGWDYGQFFIDGAMQDEWSGTVPWGQVSYNVTAGSHTLRWVYDKDGSLSSGSDLMRIDYIVLTGGTI